MEKKKITPKHIVLLSIAATFFILFIYWLIAVYRIGDRTYDNYSDFRAAGGVVYYEIPESAYDCRYATRKLLISKTYFASMKLSDEDYEKFVSEYKNKGNKYFGVRTVDAKNPDYPTDDFPLSMRYRLVTDRNIEDFTILQYWPRNTGGKHYATITCADDNLVLFYKMVSL